MTMITTTDELIKALTPLHTTAYITLDTEFIRESTFFPVLCLIQVAGPDHAFAIDPLAPGIDLTPLYEILQNDQVLKVLHSGRQDLEIFFNLTGELPKSVFDTQIAAMVCGFGESVSYENLVTSLTSHRIDKSLQYSNWLQRPLTDRQVTYALSDVIYLREVYEKLWAKINRKNRASWLDQEHAQLTSKELYINDPQRAYLKLKPRKTDHVTMHILKELAAWRETEAISRNVPKRRIIADDVLIELATLKPRDLDDIKEYRSLPRGFYKTAVAETVVLLIQHARANVPPKGESAGHEASIEYASTSLELLKLLVKLVSEQEHVASKMIATSEDLKNYLRKKTPDVNDVPFLSGWRYELFGKYAQKLLDGKLTFGLNKGHVVFYEGEG